MAGIHPITASSSPPNITFRSGLAVNRNGHIQRAKCATSNTIRKHSRKTALPAIFTFSVSGQAPASGRQRSPVAPRAELVKATVNEAYEQFKNETSGKNADYIPALAKVNSTLFGVALVSPDNQSYTLGDVAVPFSIQSISKVYSLRWLWKKSAPRKRSPRLDRKRPGRPFNSVSAVVDMPKDTGNSLVNAGAIATVSLISGNASSKWTKILNFYSKAAGERLSLLQDV